MTYLDTSHLRPVMGLDIFSARLASQEADRLAARLASTHGVSDIGCKRFAREATTVLTRAIHEDPSAIRSDMSEVANRASRAVLSGSKRADIVSDLESGMLRAAGLVHGQSQPQVVSDPFAEGIEATPIEPDEGLRVA